MTRYWLVCIKCGEKYAPDVRRQLCSSCGGILTVSYDYEEVKLKVERKSFRRDFLGVWKYCDLLPVSDKDSWIALGEGGTFLHKCERLSEELRVKSLFVKNETMNPTGAFMDRGVAVLVSKIRESGFESVSCWTTGNLGASLAAYAAKAGLECVIFVPSNVDLGKLFQMIAYGARVEPAKDIDEARRKAESCSAASFMVTTINPFLLEGNKTTGFEVVEQLEWNTPDRIVLPMGNGGHISMTWKALGELKLIGLVEDLDVTLTGVQLAEAAPIASAFLKGEDEIEVAGRAGVFAVDIGIREPSLGGLALRSIRESHGNAATVSHREILEAISLLAKCEGIFAEPAAASTIAGLKKLLEYGSIDRSEEIVCVITGSGLKDPVTARSLVHRFRGVEMMLKRVEERRFTTTFGPTKVRILKLLSEREMYGYEICLELAKRFDVKVKVPTVYQHLSELEHHDLVSSTHRRRVLGRPERIYYALTDKGRQTLRSLPDI